MYRILYKYQGGETETSLDKYYTVKEAEEKIKLVKKGPLGGSVMCSIVTDKIQESSQTDILIDMVKIHKEFIDGLTAEIQILKNSVAKLEIWQERVNESNRNEY